jgi:AcrR family transcriptional regulator
MPLPRFERLTPKRQAALLKVARRHLARDGLEKASFNQIIVDAGISKTSAYFYFDGKDDLIAQVERELFGRLGQVVGVWRPARSRQAFWTQLRAASTALHRHLAAHPDDVALLGQHRARPGPAEPDPWFEAMFEDGVSLGVIRADVDRDVLLSATIAVFRAVDAWVLTGLLRGERVDPEQGWKVLRGLWSKST